MWQGCWCCHSFACLDASQFVEQICQQHQAKRHFCWSLVRTAPTEQNQNVRHISLNEALLHGDSLTPVRSGFINGKTIQVICWKFFFRRVLKSQFSISVLTFTLKQKTICPPLPSLNDLLRSRPKLVGQIQKEDLIVKDHPWPPQGVLRLCCSNDADRHSAVVKHGGRCKVNW